MVNPNGKSNILNKLSGTVIPLSIIYLLFFVIILSGESLLKSNNRKKQLETINLWTDSNDNKQKYEPLFQKPIGNIHEKMKAIHAYINDDRTTTEKNKKLIIGAQKSPPQYNIPWILKKGGDTVYLSYKYGTPILSEKRNNDSPEEIFEQLEESEKEVFADFIGKIKKEIYSENLQPNSEATEISGEKYFKKYSDKVLEYFLNSDNYNYRKKLPYLRAGYIYIANEIGAIIQYPAQDKIIPFPDFSERPWWKATEGEYISHFNGNEGENKWGITGSYPDIDAQGRGLNLVKTVWYQFIDQKSQKKYVLCLDLFFDTDSEVPIKSNLNLPYFPFEITLPLTKYILLDSLLISTIFTLLFGVIYEFKLKKNLGKNLGKIIAYLQDYNQDSLTIKLKREENRYFLDKSDNNIIKIETQYNTEKQEENEQSSEAGWQISNANLVTVGQRINHRRINQNVSAIRFTSNKEYDLSIKNNNSLRCIEVWKVTFALESDESENNKIGTFVVEWNNTINTDVNEQLDIKSIHWEKKYQDCKDNMKQELLNHLLSNEDEEYLTVIGRKKPEFQGNVPEFFKQIDGVRETIDRSKYLRQRKFIFPEITIINKLHELGQRKAICSQNLLKLLKDHGAETLSKFLEQREQDEIFWLEKTKEELQFFYEEFDANIQEILNASSLKPMIYPQDIKNNNFCIVQINNKPKIVADIFTDDRYEPAGSFSCSWREVDLEFYKELFEMLKENGTFLEWSSLG